MNVGALTVLARSECECVRVCVCVCVNRERGRLNRDASLLMIPSQTEILQVLSFPGCTGSGGDLAMVHDSL